MIREQAATLTRESARRLTGKIRDALAVADDLIVRAYEGRAWEALGHPSWEAYCVAELPELRAMKLRAPVRRARVHALLDAGASIREAAVSAGASVGSAHADAKAREVPHERSELNTPAPLPQVSNVQRVAALVASAGDHGLTVREVCRKAAWHHGQASSALTVAHKRGLIVRSGVYRERCAAYLRP